MSVPFRRKSAIPLHKGIPIEMPETAGMNVFETWFASRGWTPFDFQREVWNAYRAGESGLVHAATGTGKTLAAWGGPLLEWMSSAVSTARNPRRDRTPPLRVLWITPLRALAADTEAALRQPLEDLEIPWSLESRTGDTSATLRARQRRRLPTALITTPESLSLLLTRNDAAGIFADLRLVVVDEWHELMGTKRGVLVELALARLRCHQPDVRTWGLSATIGNLTDAADALLGVRHPRAFRIVRGVDPKDVVIDALIPPVIERFPWAGHLGTPMVPQVVAALEEAASAIVFTNTRSQTEMWYQAILAARPDWARSRCTTGRWTESAASGSRTGCAPASSDASLRRRRSTSGWTSRRSTVCCRSAARKASRDCFSGRDEADTVQARRVASPARPRTRWSSSRSPPRATASSRACSRRDRLWSARSTCSPSTSLPSLSAAASSPISC